MGTVLITHLLRVCLPMQTAGEQWFYLEQFGAPICRASVTRTAISNWSRFRWLSRRRWFLVQMRAAVFYRWFDYASWLRCLAQDTGCAACAITVTIAMVLSLAFGSTPLTSTDSFGVCQDVWWRWACTCSCRKHLVQQPPSRIDKKLYRISVITP